MNSALVRTRRRAADRQSDFTVATMLRMRLRLLVCNCTTTTFRSLSSRSARQSCLAAMANATSVVSKDTWQKIAELKIGKEQENIRVNETIRTKKSFKANDICVIRRDT